MFTCFFPPLLGSGSKVLWPVLFPCAPSLREEPRSPTEVPQQMCIAFIVLYKPNSPKLHSYWKSCLNEGRTSKSRSWNSKTLQVLYANSLQSTPVHLHTVFPLPILKKPRSQRKNFSCFKNWPPARRTELNTHPDTRHVTYSNTSRGQLALQMYLQWF